MCGLMAQDNPLLYLGNSCEVQVSAGKTSVPSLNIQGTNAGFGCQARAACLFFWGVVFPQSIDTKSNVSQARVG
jgi:hypothetical protein